MEADSGIGGGGILSGRWVAAGFALALLATGPVAAGGLPMRALEAEDPALVMLAEGLDFKLARLVGSPAGTWVAAVDEVLHIAGRLGFPAESGVKAERVGQTFVILRDGEGYIAGADPDAVLGKLLYQLAHTEPAPDRQRSAAALAILDQPLSATLAALPSPVP